VQGRRAYELARAGETVALEPRRVHVERLECTRFDYPIVELKIACSSGTYVRSLVRDIGEDLGCGAVMTGLSRTAIGPFLLADALNVEQLNPQAVAEHLLPASAAVQELSALTAPDDQLEDIAHGRVVWATSPPARFTTDQEFALLNSTGELVGVAQLDPSGRLLRPHIVFIERNTANS
ncbi:MAG: tRNA pseudouridine(55) synthase TruB, partial [Planctomycetes bacterium]|nr:tRNA pseudouridine(55) synthase TruB [Planctomycetota bacterium]